MNQKKSNCREPVLIANRGEIAIRIARTCKALGFPTIAIYSEADRFSEYIQYCDEAYCVGPAASQESYLKIENVLEIAKRAKAKYIHPGYGFLSERPHFVEACEAENLIFVGPSASSMRQMGDKIQARKTVDELQVPRVPGSAGVVKEIPELIKIANQIGFPVLLKAAAGGGGKGMRKVDSVSELESSLESASREALSAFGDGSMYLEKFILKPHHVEVQVFGDGQGNAIHLGERECSIQRRHQKVWEESPSPILERFPKTRALMYEAAVRVCKKIRYQGAGTFEFIVDEEGNFYFLEMNTRLQVEHPVTEWVTGIDLVAWQMLLAANEFHLPQSVNTRGASIEVRLYAEDPHSFLPAPGKLGLIQFPSGPFVRSDSAYRSGQEGGREVSVHYDPMIAKISVWAPTRPEAVERLRVALDETQVEPAKKNDLSKKSSLKTNLSFLKKLVRHPQVKKGDTTTAIIADHPELTSKKENKEFSFESVAWETLVATSLIESLSVSENDFEEKKLSHLNQSLWISQARREGSRS